MSSRAQPGIGCLPPRQVTLTRRTWKTDPPNPPFPPPARARATLPPGKGRRAHRGAPGAQKTSARAGAARKRVVILAHPCVLVASRREASSSRQGTCRLQSDELWRKRGSSESSCCASCVSSSWGLGVGVGGGWVKGGAQRGQMHNTTSAHTVPAIGLSGAVLLVCAVYQ